MSRDFLAGLNKVTLNADLYERKVYTLVGLACETSTGGACGQPIDPPSTYPHGGTTDWSSKFICPQPGLYVGMSGPRIFTQFNATVGGSPIFTWDEEVFDCPSPIVARPINKKRYYYWMTKREIKMSFEDAMSGPTGLRTTKPYGDGWRIVAVVPCGTDLDEISSLKGLEFKTQENYKDYVADKLGEGDGGSGEGFGGSETDDGNIQLHESVDRIHRRGNEDANENDFVIAGPKEDTITLTEDEDGNPQPQVNLTEEDGIKDTSRWWIGFNNQTGGISGCQPGITRYPFAYRRMTSDLCCFDVYMKKVDTTDNDTGIGEGDDFLTEENADNVLDNGSYSGAIDGGINDRSNGQRFIGTSWDQLRGFDEDGQVIYDSLYSPEGTTQTTRWGENLDLSDPDTTYNGRTLGYAFVAGPGDFLSYDMTVEEITNNLDDPDTMTFVENLKYDDCGANIIHIGTPSANENDVDAYKAFDWLDSTNWESNDKSAIVTWDFGMYVLAETTLANATTEGDDTITLIDASGFPETGTIIIEDGANEDIVAYTSKSGNVLQGIPTDIEDGYSVETHSSGRRVLKRVFRPSRTIKKYSLKITSDVSKAPKTWEFQGSDNGSAWTILNAQTDVIDWTADEERLFSIDDSNTDKFRYYRIQITDTVGGNSVAIVNFGMHEYDTWTVGDWVYGVVIEEGVGPQTKFAGTIVRKERVLSEGEQIIRYYASGLVQRLNDLGFAFEVLFTNSTVREMAELVAENIPSQIVVDVEGLDLLPDTVIPDINWNSVTYKRALDMLMDISGYYSYYITPQRVLKFINLRYDENEDSGRQLTYDIPEENEALDTNTHFVLSKSLSIDTSQTKTRCQIIGDFEEIEITERIPIVTDDSDILPPYAIKITDAPTGVDEQNDIEDTYFIVLSHNRVQAQLISDEQKAVDVKVNYSPASYAGVRVFGGWFAPRSNPYSFVTKDVYSAFYIKVFKSAKEFEMTYAYKTDTPIKADTGWSGTAYTDFGVQNAILALDRRFKKKMIRTEVVRDDTVELEKYARQLIDPYKDWYIGGTVELDGHRLEIDLEKFINFSGTGQKWEDINAYVKAITYNFLDLRTSVQLSNNYFIGSIVDPNIAEDTKVVKDSEEVQRILQRLRTLELRTEEL